MAPSGEQFVQTHSATLMLLLLADNWDLLLPIAMAEFQEIGCETL